MLPIIVRLWGRWTGKGPEFIKGAYSLGFWGWFLNMVGLLYLIFACITFNFPSVTPVTSENMNYTCAAVGASVLIAGVNWFWTGRTEYRGPQLITGQHINEFVTEVTGEGDYEGETIPEAKLHDAKLHDDKLHAA